MRNLTILAITLLCISCQQNDLPTIKEISADFIEVKFSHWTTKTEMAQIKNEIEKISEVDFNYEGSEFFDDGNLRSLDFKVKTSDGLMASESADLESLKVEYHGFRYETEGTTSLSAGLLKYD